MHTTTVDDRGGLFIYKARCRGLGGCFLIRDILNTGFGLPSIGDYYYDAPDLIRFYKQIDEAINPVRRENNGIVARDYYCEEPPALGHDENNQCYVFGLNAAGGSINGSESVGAIKVDDGDTISFPYNDVVTGDDDSANYIKQTITSAEADGSPNARSIIRMACMDCKELPHFVCAGDASQFSGETTTLTYDEAKKKGYLVSKYKSFMDEPEVITQTYDGQDVNGTFYKYDRVADSCSFMKLENGTWRQYFDADGKRHFLVKADCNDYTENTIADAGIARDTLVNAISNAEELRFVVDETALNKDMNLIKTMYKTNPFDPSVENSINKTLDMFFDRYTQYTTAGFNYYGLDNYGRMIAAVYGKFKNSDGSYTWVNLNKMVIANSNTTEVNKYREGGAGSPAIDSQSYERLDEKAYADAIYDQSKKFDDRADVQGEIFKSLGKTYNEKFTEWSVTIGDVSLFVPPTSIRCVTQSKSERLPLVRARGTMAKSPQKIQRLVEMTVYFNESHGINGFEYKTKTGMEKNGKEVTYHMNGLRALFAQFKLAPFLPIENKYINEMLGIDAVYLINFTCNTVPNFPKLLQVTLQMAEFDYRIYMPEIPMDDSIADGGYRNYFAKQINYPLFRYYYQRLLMRGEALKDTPFMDKEYIESTFGNKTALIPMKFMNPYVKFYVPNRAQLEKMLETKKARLTQPVTENFTDEMFAFAEDAGKLKDQVDHINDDGANPIYALNNYIKELDGKNIIIYNSTNNPIKLLDDAPAQLVRVEGVNNLCEMAVCDGDSWNGKATESFLKQVRQYGKDYASFLSDITNANGESLIGGAATTDIRMRENDGLPGSKDTLILDVVIPINAPYLSEEDMKSIRTACSAYSDNTSKEVFEDRAVRISVEIPLKDGKAALGEECEGFSYYKEGDYAALDYLANKVLPMRSNKGNDASNDVKALVDYVSPDSIKFEAYNDEDKFLVEAINMGVSNSFSQITLQETNGYAPQYMGGTDTTLTISLYTKSESAASAMNFLPSLAAQYAREYRLVLAAWPLRIESEFTKFFGITEVMVENVEVDTVPNYPGLYHVVLNLVSVDRTIRNREALSKADLEKAGGGNFHALTKEGLAWERRWNYQFMNKYLSDAELYPDLELPELSELADAGFRFVRYSNKDRKRPDPDFYFTYSYMLVSEMIRETVLNGINNGEITLMDGVTGGSITATHGKLQGELRKQLAIEKGWDKTIDEAFSDEDEKMTARIITDFTNSNDRDRDEVWTIAPTVKVALCEKRMTNHINDAEKRRYQQEYGGDLQIDSVPAGTEEDNKDPNDANGQRYYEVSKDKLEKTKENINKVLADILSMTIEDMQSAGLVKITKELVKSFNTMQGNEEEAATTGANIDKWLEAAADAICSYGNVPYSSTLSNTKDGKAPWKYKDKCRARIDRYGYWEDIEFDKSDPEYAQLIEYVKYNSVRFGYFDFKYYTEDELEMRFGAYGTTKGDFFGKGNVAIGRPGYGKIYLADPGYRFESAQKQVEYIYKCTTDFGYAKMAFFRICLLYLKVLIDYDIFPSFSYDIFREAVLNKERMEKVLKRINEERKKEEAKQEKAQKEQQGKATQTDRYNKSKSDDKSDDKDKPKTEESGDGNNTEQMDEGNETAGQSEGDGNTEGGNAGNGSEAAEGTPSSVEATQVEQYQKEFKKNRQAIDNGKIFLTIAMGVVDGNHDFVKMLLNRDHEAMNAISAAAAKSTNLLGDTNGASKYVPKLSAFIRAMGGEKIIDSELIGTGDSTGPANVFAQIGARKNVAAAASDPETYLVHSFYDMVVNDCRGRMLRAFPTFYMVIIDEGRKIGKFRLHDNFYNTSAISSITIAQSRKIPTDTAEIVMSNFYKSFTTDDEDLNMNYTANFTDVFDSVWLPTLQSYAEKEDRRRTNTLNVERVHLRPGARVHLRIGYGADASHLPISFNGMVAELETGDVIKLICQSDGAELAKPIMLDRQAYELPGIDQWFGSASMCENGATPRTIMNTLMNCHDGKINSIIHDLGYDEAASFFNINTNPLGIYHFGNPDAQYAGDRETMQNIFEVGMTDTYARYIQKAREEKEASSLKEKAAAAGAGGAVGAGIAAATVATGGAALLAFGAGAAVAGALSLAADDFKGINSFESDTSSADVSLWDELTGKGDVIPRLNFDVFGKTVWDVANICRSVDPEYICAIAPFHLRSTLFMGRPNDYYAYDYALEDGGWVEKRKPYQQYHIYSSYTDIINNNIAVSTKDMRTCAVGLYTVSGFMNTDVQKRTDPQWLDASIYPEYQKTMYVDTKLYGKPSRKLGVASDILNALTGGVTNSTFDRAFDDEGDVRNHHATAVKMTRSALKMAAKEMYQGRITVIGDPSIKPNDRMCITDTYNGITGQCLARDIVHVFSCDDGFKTVITPDLITAQVGTDAGNELKRQSALNVVVNAFAGTVMYLTALYATMKARDMFSAVTGSKIAATATDVGKKAASLTKGLVETARNSRVAGTLSSLEKVISGVMKGYESVKKAAGALGSVIEAGEAVAGGAWGILKKLKGGPVGIIACTLGLGMAEDMIVNFFKSRKCLVIFPLQKYGRPMVGGVDGNIGSVYGAPNFNTQDNIQKGLSWASGIISSIPVVGEALDFAGRILDEQVNHKTDNSEMEAQKTMNLINKSHIGGLFSKAYFNPTKPRYDVTKKDGDEYKEIIAKYAVVDNTEEELRKNANFRQYMTPVVREERLKRYLDLGYFRVAATEKGFSETLSSQIKPIHLPDVKDGGDIPVNAIVRKDGNLDIPFLNRDAIGVLCEIVRQSYTMMAGTENERDADKWYEDNKGKFVTLTSGLICGAVTKDNSKGTYEATGFSFVLTTSDKAALTAVNSAISRINKQMKESHQSMERIPEAVMSTTTKNGNEVYIVVHPPKG